MKKIMLRLMEVMGLLLITFYLLPIIPVYAHILKTDGSIGAVFHTDPDDNVVAGVPTQIFFDLKDAQNKFKFSECKCTVTISDNQKTIDLPLTGEENDSTTQVGYSSYTFDHEGDYQIKISGTPKTLTSFQQFNLSYDLHVEKIAPQPVANSTQNWIVTHTPHLIGITIVVIFLILTLVKLKFNLSKKTK